MFDGSEEEEDVEGSRLPLLIVLALLVLAMFAGVVWLAYTQGVARGRGETPVLTAAAGPERVAPPSGRRRQSVPYQGFKIYEQPAPPDDSADNAPPAPQAHGIARQPPSLRRRQACAAPAAQRQSPHCRRQPSWRPPGLPKPAPARQTPRPPPRIGGCPDPAGRFHARRRQRLLPSPRLPPSRLRRPSWPGHGRAPPAGRRCGNARSAPRRCASARGKACGLGGYVLQIGAYKSQADADAAWKVYKAKHAALLSALFRRCPAGRSGRQGHLVSPAHQRLCRQGHGHGPVRPAEGGRRRLYSWASDMRAAARDLWLRRPPACRRRRRSFFREAQPWGFILFARNIERPEPDQSTGSGIARHGRRQSRPSPDRPGRRAGWPG